jgi:L-threonylcarbamoyladenylate synthase
MTAGPTAREMRLRAGEEITADAIARAAAVVAAGGVLLYPTDTIYGLGCDALRPGSVRRVYALKERPEEKPMIVLVSGVAMAESLVAEVPAAARAIMRAFWPGPLTLLFPADAARVPWLTGATGKIGLRYPEHAFCRRLMEASGLPLLSTSANRSGEAYAGDVSALRALFGSSVDLFVDAGALPASAPSTIVDVSSGVPALVREGAVPASALARYFAGEA